MSVCSAVRQRHFCSKSQSPKSWCFFFFFYNSLLLKLLPGAVSGSKYFISSCILHIVGRNKIQEKAIKSAFKQRHLSRALCCMCGAAHSVWSRSCGVISSTENRKAMCVCVCFTIYHPSHWSLVTLCSFAKLKCLRCSDRSSKQNEGPQDRDKGGERKGGREREG